MAGLNAAVGNGSEATLAAAAPIEKERPKEVVIKLVTPVQAHGETLTEIKFRRPTGKDVMSIGDDYPIHIDWATGQVRPNPPAMGQIMSRLAAVPPSTIESMEAEDWATCAHALMGFFPPGAQAMQF